MTEATSLQAEVWGAGNLAVMPSARGAIAVGSTAEGIAVWRTTDLAAWQRSDPPGLAIAETGFGASTYGITARDSTTIAFGRAGDAGTPIWISSDGRAWAQAATPTAPGEGFVADVAWIGDRFFAIGSDGTAFPFIWESTDGGATWTVRGALLSSYARALVPTADGEGVMVTFDEDSDSTKLVVVRPDGMVGVPTSPELNGFSALAATWFDDTLVLAGTESAGTGGIVVVTSRDLETWDRLTVAPGTAGRWLVADALVADGTLVLAVSGPGGPAFVSTGDLEFWTMRDLRTPAGPTALSPRRIAWIDGRLVVGGAVYEGDALRYAVSVEIP